MPERETEQQDIQDYVQERDTVADENARDHDLSYNDGDIQETQRTRKRGRNPHLESTVQHLELTKTARAPNTGNFYYRDNFANIDRRTKAPDLCISPAHAGLSNCDQICYSNAIFQGLASCIRVSQFFQSPPRDDEKRFPLYHAFASVMSSMVSGRETVVDPSEFITLFKQSRNINPARGMLEDGEEEEAQEVVHEDAHEYLLHLEKCLLNELKQKEDGSSDTDYDEELYTNMKTFWALFGGGQTAITLTCTSCGYTKSGNVDDFDALLLYFPENHHYSDEDCTLEDLLTHHCGTLHLEDYKCDNCHQSATTTKRSVFTNCPPILSIVLVRKKQNGGSINSDGGSINSSVNFPVSGFSITEDHLQYNLVGTVHHKPDGHEHGHYTSICHSQRSPHWYLYDDEDVILTQFVKKQQKEGVLKKYTKTAFILFYELQTHDGSEDIIDLQSNDTDGSGESHFSAS